jgi:hypothetical protein
MRYYYQTQKDNAKRRGKPFELTIDQFRWFAVKYDMLHGKGRKSESYSIDCIDPDKGYVMGNIQRLSLGENSSKGRKKIVYDYRTKTGGVEVSPPRKNEKHPF